MNAGTSVFAGVAAVIAGIGALTTAACSGPVQGGSTDYTEATPVSTAAPAASSIAGGAAPITAITASTRHPGPSDVAAAVPPPAATTVTAAVTPPPAAVTAPAAPVVSAPAASTATPGAPASSGWNAGSGTAMPDGKTIEYHIPDGTGGKDWNPKDNPIRVRRGMVLHLVDDDKSVRAGGHWLHTNGQPCFHGLKAIGQGFDCDISTSAPNGVVPGVFEHNVANGIGQLYIDVVADAN